MKPTSVKPCGHNLVIEPIEMPRETTSGIILNLEGTEWERMERAGRTLGVIIAVGPQCWKAHAALLNPILGASDPARKPWAEVGDTVMYVRHAGKFVFDPMEEEKRQLYLIHDEDVLAVLPPQSEWKASLLDMMD